MNRRESLQSLGLAATALMFPRIGDGASPATASQFRFCLNTSTIRGQQLGLKNNIDIAARAGYDSLELWVDNVKHYVNEGHSLSGLSRYIRDTGLEVANAIGFAPWMSDDENISNNGFMQMKEEMEMMASIGCTRIAAPPAGDFNDPGIDLFRAGEKYRRLIELGRQTGVMPQLEFWGSSEVLYHMGQIMMMAAVADDPDVRLLPDVYHMYRGGSGFESLKMLQGHSIEIFHMNDYPGNTPAEKLTDADRVYPGDGHAPLETIFADLKAMGGMKYLSLELFNRSYWEQDALQVAKTGLEKMKKFI